MTTPVPAATPSTFEGKLWLYTNYDCNLRCSYCVARSSPEAPRRALGLDNACRLIDQALELGFDEVFFTGGEPFILSDIYAMLAYASARIKTSVLTNAMLLRGKRLAQLLEIANDNLAVQVSLDGGVAQQHDAYRGAGTWVKTVEGIQRLQAHGFHVRLSSTETPANLAHLDLICEFHRRLGIPEADHFVRPMARRGFSTQGLEVDMNNLAPETTVNQEGVFWHPLSTDPDMQVSREIFPLKRAVERIQAQLEAIARDGHAPPITFT